MAEKDIAEKILMSYADVFADCVNALVYGGQHRLCGEDLQPAPTESFYQGKGRMRNQFCDKSFFRMEGGKVMAQYILENETRLHRRQVLRTAAYQGGAYREQLNLKEVAYPVISIVLDWTRRRSRIPLSLHQLLAECGAFLDEILLADDTKLTVCHMKNLPGEVRNRFVSDMGFVVDYLNEGNLEGRRNQEIVHIRELCDMMEAISGDSRFTEQMEELLEKRRNEEGVRMCEYLDMLEARGQARGEQIGQERGENRLAQLIQFLLKEKKYREAEMASSDKVKRQELYRLYGI